MVESAITKNEKFCGKHRIEEVWWLGAAIQIYSECTSRRKWRFTDKLEENVIARRCMRKPDKRILRLIFEDKGMDSLGQQRRVI
ncbi:MAG: hypothetical protein PHP64_00610 [Actinomycetota bacterium]|nr:hypothetical protein [Actinomycetota bacterium]